MSRIASGSVMDDEDDRPGWVPAGLTPERVLALAGTAALMLVALVSLVMIASVGGDEREASAPLAQSTPTATPTATPTPKPTPVPLTPDQRAAREAAAKILTDKGFTPLRLRDYDPRRRLRVLLGKQVSGTIVAFFFVDDRYIGNDTSEPSAKVRVKRKSETQVTLAYSTYAPGDEPCCPTGGPIDVRFRWNGSALVPQDPIPPAQQRTPGYQ